MALALLEVFEMIKKLWVSVPYATHNDMSGSDGYTCMVPYEELVKAEERIDKLIKFVEHDRDCNYFPTQIVTGKHASIAV